MLRRLALGLATCVALAGLPAEGRAERAWVKDEVRLNVRTGPGNQYRILRVATTGDSLEVLSSGEGWTQVRAEDGLEGWIPEGFLAQEPPAVVRLARSEAETAELRERFATLSKEVEELRTRNGELTALETSQSEELERLTRENLGLQAGARWPHWITGASIFLGGGLVGMIVVLWNSSRRAPRRVRL
jgi:SH3 domain protein